MDSGVVIFASCVGSRLLGRLCVVIKILNKISVISYKNFKILNIYAVKLT